MRRVIPAVIVAALVLILVMALSGPFRMLLKRLGGDTSNLRLIPKSTVSIAYVLEEGRWTSFDIPRARSHSVS
ncbi:MAG: hypothetical protein MZV70_13660 [Desulfobacterales bacterium]|nr:hypothetical protein [Desulfobacterales bacterium]